MCVRAKMADMSSLSSMLLKEGLIIFKKVS